MAAERLDLAPPDRAGKKQPIGALELTYVEHCERVRDRRPTTYAGRVFGPLAGEQFRRSWALRNAPARFANQQPRLHRMATQLLECCEQAAVVEDDQGNIRITEKRCRSRLCVRCAKLRQRELLAKLAPRVKHFDAPKIVTLTTRSTRDIPLREQLQRLGRLFRKLRQDPRWKSRVAGGFWGIECTYSRKHGWHPHLHALVDSPYIPWQQLRQAWEQLVGEHAGVDIRAVHSRQAAAKYVAEYVSKSSNLEQLQNTEIPEWALAVHGLRLIQTFGHLHKLRIEAEAKADYSYRRILHGANDLARRAAYGNVRAETALRVLGRLSGDDDRLPRTAYLRILGNPLAFELGLEPLNRTLTPCLNANRSTGPPSSTAALSGCGPPGSTSSHGSSTSRHAI